MSEQQKIQDYYNKLAKDYNKSRFGNSYGEFLNKQEENLIIPLLKLFDPMKILNLGCGTGRFMEYCNYGLDFSEQMLNQAIESYPSKDFTLSDAAATNFPDYSFDLVLSMHVIMHLNKEKSKTVFDEVFRLLRPGGRFIFDVPSKTRRDSLKGHHNKSWHGSNAYTISEIKETFGENWELIDQKGILFLPIHRFPNAIRSYFFGIDTFLCRNLSPDYASYMLIVMQKDK